MRLSRIILTIAAFLIAIPSFVNAVLADGIDAAMMHTERENNRNWGQYRSPRVQLGPRPFYLVEQMKESELKTVLQECAKGPFYKTDFSIGHRGAPLQFPEHTKESYEAAARMGAGILECDVTFTKDRELVCRHSQCDLHTTTNILAIPELAAKCTEPFTPADPTNGTPASAKCCASDISLAEYKTLCGKMDASNPTATTIDEYLGGTSNWRTDLYSSCGTVLSHKESIELFSKLGVKFTPELKAPSVEMPFEGDYTQEDYAQQLIDEYRAAGVPPWKVYAQSFNPDDVLYWIKNEPQFGKRAVYLDDRYENDPPIDPNNASTFEPSMEEIAAQGVNIIAPPMWMLLTVEDGRIAPSEYAKAAKNAGLDIITWTLERSGRITEDVLPTKGTDDPSFYYQSTLDAIENDGGIMVTLDVLAQKVGILGIFSDWPATVTYYANCTGVRHTQHPLNR